jgi:hypothetical protein
MDSQPGTSDYIYGWSRRYIMSSDSSDEKSHLPVSSSMFFSILKKFIKVISLCWSIKQIGNAPYWCTHHFLMGHIKFYGTMALPKVISVVYSF